MTTYLVLHLPRGGATSSQQVEARTPEAAVRKVYGRNTAFGAMRATAAGALRALEFSTAYGQGEVQWAIEPGVVLVRHSHREDDAPFWANPDTWTSHDTYPLTVLSPAT